MSNFFEQISKVLGLKAKYKIIKDINSPECWDNGIIIRIHCDDLDVLTIKATQAFGIALLFEGRASWEGNFEHSFSFDELKQFVDVMTELKNILKQRS